MCKAGAHRCTQNVPTDAHTIIYSFQKTPCWSALNLTNVAYLMGSMG